MGLAHEACNVCVCVCTIEPGCIIELITGANVTVSLFGTERN